MTKIITCKECGEEKPHKAKGLCKNCYQKQNKIICLVCGELKQHRGRGLCNICHRKQNLIICKKCGESKPHAAKGLCLNCYSKQNLIVCKNCGELKPHHRKGMCGGCFKKQNLIKCKKCGELKPHQAKGLCNKCYDNERGKHQPSNENKECTLYLGLMAEKLLSKVFTNVTRMPNNNAGYDFICNKGMKIDVKSSVLLFRKNSPNNKGHWTFSIKRNIISDYFLCIAFDNRENKTPLHLWLIPSKEVNHLQTLGISKNQTQKYSQYEQPLEKTLECCESMKI